MEYSSKVGAIEAYVDKADKNKTVKRCPYEKHGCSGAIYLRLTSKLCMFHGYTANEKFDARV